MSYIYYLKDVRATDVADVGGKNASLGELIGTLSEKGIHVPTGFATSVTAYHEFLDSNGLRSNIEAHIKAWQSGTASLRRTGSAIRQMILNAEFSPSFERAIKSAYKEMGRGAVAVRSSATAEDLPDASFAGQHESYLNVRGERELIIACKECIASTFTNRAISYREELGFDHLSIALSIGVQKMVRADKGASGVMFSLDTESGFPKVVLITAAFGLGEPIVQGQISPDEYVVFKDLLDDPNVVPIIQKTVGSKVSKMVYGAGGHATKLVPTTPKEQSRAALSDHEILKLARWAKEIEAHYGRPMDIEWAKDGLTGELFIVQARPETIHADTDQSLCIESHQIVHKGKCLLSGLAVGRQIASGHVLKVKRPQDVRHVPDNSILVTESTSPDWVPLMKQVKAVITDQGGRTSHAAIVSRELGLPAIVGVGTGTRDLKPKKLISVSCAEGAEGHVYEGGIEYTTSQVKLGNVEKPDVNLMLNLSDPSAAADWWKLPAAGVGLARMEFVISHHIKIHPMALAKYDTLKNRNTKREIAALTKGYDDKKQYFIERLSRGMAQLAALHYPNPVIVRMSDFKTNEYAELIGGKEFEPEEENPMLGWRGASRYYHPDYEPGFALECAAIRHAREVVGMKNIIVMIPFCRTVDEADEVLKIMRCHGLVRGERGLEVYVMCEVPSNVILAEEFAKRFDGFSIGSNDLTQLMLGVDRDSERIADLFDESNPAVKAMILQVIEKAHRHGCKVGFCGQAPSDRASYAQFLAEAGIDSISVTPDSFLNVLSNLSQTAPKKELVKA